MSTTTNTARNMSSNIPTGQDIASLPAQQIQPGQRVWVAGWHRVTHSALWGQEWRIRVATGQVLWLDPAATVRVAC